ncbi:STAS domain-containing protein [Lignipirellula cremea]|uniref:STAS domain protein n=1 Tax=Lignipirellula cremea TaxID=2528010 RepID=A0A518DR19_9BACT|nr:STAS domain-containing protein [Lignipirellula cremea]QDU94288.1 STAS domain protein [Lignipirellula cremea]
MADYQYLDLRKQEGVLVATLRDVNGLDSLQLGQLTEELVRLVEEERPPRLVVGFQEVSLCTTTVVNGLLSMLRRIKAQGGQMRLCGMSDNVRASFQILNLDGSIFDIDESELQALANFT